MKLNDARLRYICKLSELMRMLPSKVSFYLQRMNTIALQSKFGLVLECKKVEKGEEDD